jgi:hypothetical protein
LLIIRQVRLFKQVKNDLFNWSQLMNIVSSVVIAGSIILLLFVTFSMAVMSYPFLMTAAVNKKTESRFLPNNENKSVLYISIINALSILVALSIGAMGIGLRRLRKKREIDFAIKVERLIMVSMFITNISLALICTIGCLCYIKEIE